MNLDNVLEQLVQDEGFRGMPYLDHLGKPTIGIGTLLPITVEEAKILLQYRLKAKIDELYSKEVWIGSLPEEAQEILINMCYQLGVNGLLKFKKMLSALKVEDFKEAAKEGLDSKWAKQTPSRANRLMEQLANIS